MTKKLLSICLVKLFLMPEYLRCLPILHNLKHCNAICKHMLRFFAEVFSYILIR